MSGESFLLHQLAAKPHPTMRIVATASTRRAYPAGDSEEVVPLAAAVLKNGVPHKHIPPVPCALFRASPARQPMRKTGRRPGPVPVTVQYTALPRQRAYPSPSASSSSACDISRSRCTIGHTANCRQ